MKDVDQSIARDATLREAKHDHLLYVLPLDAVRLASQPSISARMLWKVVREQRWWLLLTMGLCLAASVAYATLATRFYRAEIVLMPARSQAQDGIAARLGGLASLAGIGLGSSTSAEPMAVLRSQEFTRQFIEQHGLLTVLYADRWDAAAQKWKSPDPAEQPDLRDAARFFDKEVRSISTEPKTGLISVGIRWSSPSEAAEWAVALVDDLNRHMRQRALLESDVNIQYLRTQLATAREVELQQSVANLLQMELQKSMLAKGNTEFAFKVVDRPVPPKRPVWPNMALVLVLGAIAGLLLSVLVLVVRFRSSVEIRDATA